MCAEFSPEMDIFTRFMDGENIFNRKLLISNQSWTFIVVATIFLMIISFDQWKTVKLLILSEDL